MDATQCRMARAALGLGVRDLAAAAKVGVATVARLERGDELSERTVEAVREALESAGIVFLAAGDASAGGGIGVRLAAKSKRGRR